MKTVKIISGAYGYVDKDSNYITPVRAGETCVVDDSEAERLVSIGVAEIVGNDIAASENDAEDEIDLESMKLSELKEFASTIGIDVSNIRSKKEVIAAIKGE